MTTRPPAVLALVFVLGACNDRVTLGSRDVAPPRDGGDVGPRFPELPPGAALPSGAECATRVPPGGVEQRPENAAANRTTATRAQLAPFHAESWVAVDERVRTEIRTRIDGAFTGTTDAIIAWAACKWGFDDDALRAAAVVLSDWRQSATSRVEPGDCPPDIALEPGGSCPHLFGLFAVNYDAEESAHSTWPMVRDSTAFNADFMGGFLRMCFEGYVTWLHDPAVTPPEDGPYVAGDAWACLGFAVAGRWDNDEAAAFEAALRRAHGERPWTKSGF